MNYNQILMEYIDMFPEDEPIFIDDIKNYFYTKLGGRTDKILNSIYVYVNRLVKSNVLIQYTKGVYYKPIKGKFGNKLLNKNKVVNKKYIKDDNGIKGYVSGATLFNEIGLTTQVPKYILVVTNECPNYNDYVNKALCVVIRKAKISVNEDNYRYLQLLDILVNKDNIKIEADNARDIIYKFIEENNLNMKYIFKYAKETNNKKAIERLYNYG